MNEALQYWLFFFVISLGGGIAFAWWGIRLRRARHRVGILCVGWGFTAPFVVPVATGITWLAVGDALPASQHEPWPWYAAVALYSTMLTALVTVVLAVAGLVSTFAEIGPANQRDP